MNLTRTEKKLLKLVAHQEQINEPIAFTDNLEEIEKFKKEYQTAFDKLNDLYLLKGGICDFGWILLTDKGKEYLKDESKGKNKNRTQTLIFLIAAIFGIIVGLIAVWEFFLKS